MTLHENYTQMYVLNCRQNETSVAVGRSRKPTSSSWSLNDAHSKQLVALLGKLYLKTACEMGRIDVGLRRIITEPSNVSGGRRRAETSRASRSNYLPMHARTRTRVRTQRDRSAPFRSTPYFRRRRNNASSRRRFCRRERKLQPSTSGPVTERRQLW